MALNINGTTGISGVDGSASAPALQGTDSNTGINFGSDTVNINTGGQTRATVDSSGKVGIGTTSPSGVLHLHKSDSGTIDGLMITNTSTTNNGLTVGVNSNEQPFFWNGSNTDMLFATNNAERMRINSSGNLTVGTTNDDGGGAANTDDGCLLRNDGLIVARVTTGTNNVAFRAKTTDTGSCDALSCFSAQTQVGSVLFNSGGTSFNTSSDYRRKENIIDLTGAIARLKTLLPKRFNFIDEPSVTRDGFLAHEVTTVPEAVWGTKDAVEPEDNEKNGVKKGDPIYQQLDQSKLVPLLTAALQEAVAKIEVLETKVAALEAG